MAVHQHKGPSPPSAYSVVVTSCLVGAAWVGQIHHQTCHVVYTEYRPTPLQHFLFPAGGEGVYLIVDDKGRFREDNFTKAMATLNDTST